jgi:hypothetical protein
MIVDDQDARGHPSLIGEVGSRVESECDSAAWLSVRLSGRRRSAD